MTSHSHGHHHHHGVLSRIVAPFRKMYHKWYVPLLVLLGNAMGGRVRAGRLGRTSRITRLVGNAITLSAIIATIVIIGGTTFLSGGAALPAWATLLVAIGIAINTTGLVIGAAANHLKIEQYYDAELEQHVDNNELREDGQKTELPHGFNAPTRKLVMSGVRYTHDVNGAAGTGASWSATILDAITWFSAGLITFEPVIGSALFIVSRASAIVSATGAVGTNQHRLWVYKTSIQEKINEHYALKKITDENRHLFVEKTVKDTFALLHIDDDHKYTEWVKFRCYKAVDSALRKDIPKTPMEENTIKKVLESSLNPLLKMEKGFFKKCAEFITRTTVLLTKQFSREKLMGIRGGDIKLSVLDSMPILEAQIFNSLSRQTDEVAYTSIDTVVRDFCSNYLVTEKDNTSDLLQFHLQKMLLKNSLKGVTKEVIKDVLIGHFFNFLVKVQSGSVTQYTLNRKIISEAYPLEGNPHGNQFLPDYHTKKLAEEICENLKGRVIKEDKSTLVTLEEVEKRGDANEEVLCIAPIPLEMQGDSCGFLPAPPSIEINEVFKPA